MALVRHVERTVDVAEADSHEDTWKGDRRHMNGQHFTSRNLSA
jgi:hypothetical protein